MVEYAQSVQRRSLLWAPYEIMTSSPFSKIFLVTYGSEVTIWYTIVTVSCYGKTLIIVGYLALKIQLATCLEWRLTPFSAWLK